MPKQAITFKFDPKLIADLKKCKEKHGTPVNAMVERASKKLVKKLLDIPPITGRVPK